MLALVGGMACGQSPCTSAATGHTDCLADIRPFVRQPTTGGVRDGLVNWMRVPYRHMTLSMTALAFLVIVRDVTKKWGSHPGRETLTALSVNEIRRLWNRIVDRVAHTTDREHSAAARGVPISALGL